MRKPSSIVALLALLAAPYAHGDDVGLPGIPSAGMRVRARVAGVYRVADVKVGEGRIEVSGDVVRRDALTLTVASRDGEETRYPRIHARLVGRVVALDAQGLRLTLGDGKPNVLVPLVAIERLEVSRRAPRQLGGKGAVIGALVPGLPLGLLGAAYFGQGNLDCESQCHSGLPLMGAALGVAAGALVGALVGSALSDDGWEEVQLGVAIAPRPGKGVAGALCLRF